MVASSDVTIHRLLDKQLPVTIIDVMLDRSLLQSVKFSEQHYPIYIIYFPTSDRSRFKNVMEYTLIFFV